MTTTNEFRLIDLFNKERLSDPDTRKALQDKIDQRVKEAAENILAYEEGKLLPHDPLRYINETLPKWVTLSHHDKQILKLMLHPKNIFVSSRRIIDAYLNNYAYVCLIASDPTSPVSKGVGKTTYALWTLLQVYQGDFQLVLNSIGHTTDKVLNCMNALAVHKMKIPVYLWDDAGVTLSSGSVIGGGKERTGVFATNEQLQLIRTTVATLLFTAPRSKSITPMIKEHVDLHIIISLLREVGLFNINKGENEEELRKAELLFYGKSPYGNQRSFVKKEGLDQFIRVPEPIYSIYDAMRKEFNVISTNRAVARLKHKRSTNKREDAIDEITTNL